MRKLPDGFANFCSIAGLPELAAEKYWREMEEKTVSQFLDWLIRENDLNNKQMEELKKIFKLVISRQENGKSFLDLVTPILNQTQKGLAIKKFAEVYLDGLDSLYEKIGEKMSLEQKQVAQAYSITAYGGTITS